MNLKSLDLQKMAASKVPVKFMPISGDFSAADITDKMIDKK